MSGAPIVVVGFHSPYEDVPTIRTAEDWRKHYDSEPPAFFTLPPSPLFARIEAEALERERNLRESHARMKALFEVWR